VRFFLGTHKPQWLDRSDQVPWFVSRRRLAERTRLPVARGPWALDSGAFSELNNPPHIWTLSVADYVAEVRRYSEEIGQLVWAAPQDWMCEPEIVAKTGLSIDEHIERTVRAVVEARELAPDLPIIPVVQGFDLDDYLRCVERYEAAGISLDVEPIVGLGSVCRRQDTSSAELIIRRLASDGLRLHGFGVKITGLARYWDALASADSMAWSLDAAMQVRKGVPSCDPSRRVSCANCLHYALDWFEEKIRPLLDPEVQPLWKEAPSCAV
jgi:hypothetical protein